MALTTYAELKTSIAGWLNVSATDLSSQIDDLITVGEKRIFREARNRDMETALSSTMVSGVVALPTSYVAMKFMYVNNITVNALERRSAEWIYQNFPRSTSSGPPEFFARDGDNFIFGPYPDSSYLVQGRYYMRLQSLATTVNAMYANNPDIYLMASLAEAEPLIGRDQRIAIWNAKYMEILQQVNGEDKVEDQSGSGLQMRLSATPRTGVRQR